MMLLAGVAYWVPNTQHQPAATSLDNTKSCSYSEHPIHTSQQQHRWTIPKAVVTVSTQYTTPASSNIVGQYQKL